MKGVALGPQQALEIRVWGLGFGVWGLGFGIWVWGVGCCVWGLELSVWGGELSVWGVGVWGETQRGPIRCGLQ